MKISDYIQREAAITVSPAVIKKLEKLTDQNDHTGSRILLAETIKEKKLAEAYKAIETIHLYWGSLPPGLGETRVALDKRLRALAQSKLDNFDEVWKTL